MYASKFGLNIVVSRLTPEMICRLGTTTPTINDYIPCDMQGREAIVSCGGYISFQERRTAAKGQTAHE